MIAKKKLCMTIAVAAAAAALLCIISALPTDASDGSPGGSCGKDLTWSYIPYTSTLIINGCGEMDEFGYEEAAPWSDYSSEIKCVIFSYGLTSISNFAFENCTSLSSVSIPGTVKYIGAFSFSGCSALRSVHIPASVTTIGCGAFSFCSSLNEINVDWNNAEYCSVNGVLYTKDMSSLLAYPAGTGDVLFAVSDSVTTIQAFAFSGCYTEMAGYIPGSVTEVGSNAYNGCSSMTYINIPTSVRYISPDAFWNCSSLNYIGVDDDNQYYSSGYGILYNNDMTVLYLCPEGVKNLNERHIPDTVKVIDYYAFENCTHLTSIDLPDSVEHIGQNAFLGCTGLTSVDLPNSLKTIGHGAFSGCKSLETITIPASVEYMEWGVFIDCDSLKTIYNHSDLDLSDEKYGLPDGVTVIDERSSESVTIEENALGYCLSLYTVYGFAELNIRPGE